MHFICCAIYCGLFFITMLLYYNQFIILTTRAFKFIYAHLDLGFCTNSSSIQQYVSVLCTKKLMHNLKKKNKYLM